MGWDSSHETLKLTSVVYKRSLRAVTKNAEWPSELAVIQRYCNILIKALIFLIKDKKNNQSSVSDADQEILTIG